MPLLHAAEQPLNVLLITADDMGYEAADFLQGQGAGKVAGVTPNLDKFATRSLCFQHGFVNAAICVPSRGIIATGLYGHNSGIYGFVKLSKKVPTVFETFQKAGYLTGILGKVSHSTPDPSYKWDFEHDYQELGAGRSPTKYHDYCAEFFALCKKENKPFYFMVNSHDPHRPFYGAEGRKLKGEEVPSKVYKPEEIAVPGYLHDLPGARQELASYYSSVRRLDDTVGRVLQALDDSGLADRTLVVFISDNGSSFPFAKANTYLASNREPFLIRWPGVTKAGSVDAGHFVSEVDFFPTFMEAAGLQAPAGMDGRSLVPLLKGQEQAGRDHVFTQIDYKAGRDPTPMRCVQDNHYAYIFNAWSDGQHAYKNNNEGETFKAMEVAGSSNPAIQARVEMFRHRVPQEFYDLEKDPACTTNLVNDPQHRELAQKYQETLRRWMVDTHDFCLAAFDARNDPAKLAAAVACYPKASGPVASDDAGATISDPEDKGLIRKEKRMKKREANNGSPSGTRSATPAPSPLLIPSPTPLR